MPVVGVSGGEVLVSAGGERGEGVVDEGILVVSYSSEYLISMSERI